MDIRVKILAGGFLLGAISLAQAADMSGRVWPDNVTKAPAAAPEAYQAWSWDGFYLGGNIGWGFGNNAFDLAGNGPNEAASIAGGFVPGSQSNNQNGFLGGVTYGFNWQLANWIVGLEGDYDFASIKGSASGSNPDAYCFNLGDCAANGVNGIGTQFGASEEIQSLGTLRARVGFLVAPRLMIFGTGGLAYGQWKASAFGGGVGPGCAAPGITCFSDYYGQASGFSVGPAAGGGIEWRFAKNWSWKVEDVWTSLGDHGFDVTSATAAANGFPAGYHETIHTDTNVVRTGLNFLF